MLSIWRQRDLGPAERSGTPGPATWQGFFFFFEKHGELCGPARRRLHGWMHDEPYSVRSRYLAVARPPGADSSEYACEGQLGTTAGGFALGRCVRVSPQREEWRSRTSPCGSKPDAVVSMTPRLGREEILVRWPTRARAAGS